MTDHQKGLWGKIRKPSKSRYITLPRRPPKQFILTNFPTIISTKAISKSRSFPAATAPQSSKQTLKSIIQKLRMD